MTQSAAPEAAEPVSTARDRRRALRPTASEALAALASAVLFAIAFPPFPFVVPVFLALVPFAVAVAQRADGDGSVRSAARIGFWFAILGYGANLYWMATALSSWTRLSFLAYGATVVTIAVIIACVAAALFVLRRATHLPMAILLPLLWVAKEVLLNYLGDIAFPWLPLGLSMAHVPLFAQLADVSGVRGVSFWIAMTNGLLADAWLLRAHRAAVARRVAAVVVAAGLVAGYGAWRLASIHPHPVASISVVQPNIPQSDKWQAANRGRIVGILDSLTRAEIARHDGEQLIVWPEVALPGFIIQHPEWTRTIRALTRSGHVPLLFGVLDAVIRSPDDYDIYNAAMLADSAGYIDFAHPYRKTYLVPIVERVPFVNPHWFSSLKFFGSFARGGTPVPFTLPFGKVGVIICYESIFPQRSRLYRREGADILLNITNDAWFGKTIAPYQHEAHLSLRAIENRVGIVRDGNTGISAYIDPMGRVHGATPLFVRTIRTYEAQSTSLHPLYVRLGDWVGTLSLVAALSLLGLAYLRRRA
ncbi:MAG TPA: apolipoprotein N-acyltransferase [Gemmatimonadaceae bacterium]|nr:apolipoprotein N-acyltransferase [Gemmatimonadaceae bacterium]